MSGSAFQGTNEGSTDAGFGSYIPPRAQQLRQSVQGGRFDRWHQENDAPAEEEGWLLTYLDTMTLLLVFMVVMLMFSEPIKKDKTESASQTMTTPAGSAASTAAGVEVDTNTSKPAAEPATQDNPLEQLPLDKLGTAVEVIKSPGSVRFRISSELLFPSGEAGLTTQGLALLDSLLPAFQVAAEHRIVVEGHTDNRPISTARYPSNWELAAGRAGSVVRHLQSRGVAPARMRATGFAETRPIAPNDTSTGQAANRRVELILELPQGGQ